MKVLDVIEVFDNIRPNSFELGLKKEWLWSIESKIRSFIAGHETAFIMDSWASDNEELSLDICHRDVYVYYLVAMADMANAEFRLYNISSLYSNELLDSWKREFRANNLPKANTNIRL